MDFHSMKRKQLQALCKKHGLPANRTNLEMAESLTTHLQVNDNPTSDGKDPNDVPKKLKKVRFSPENETREYEPSACGMPVKGSRRRTTLINSNSKNLNQSNVSDKVAGKKRGRGNEKIESFSRITRSRAKVDKKTSLIENETATIRSQDGCQKVLQLQEPLRRNAARQKSTASQKEEASKIIGVDDLEAKNCCRRSTRNVGEYKNSEVVGRVTRSKAQSVGNVSAFESKNEAVGVVNECKGAIGETNELRSARNSSRLALVAIPNEMKEIGGRDGKVGRQKRKRAVVQETESSKDEDESLVRKPPRRSTRHTLKSDFVGPSVAYKSAEKKQKRLSRLSIMIEETTPTNISSPCEDVGVNMAQAAGEKNCLTLDESNALKSHEKKEQSNSKSSRKRRNASMDVSALHSGIGKEIDAAAIGEQTVVATPIKMASVEQEKSTVAGLSVVSSDKNSGLMDDNGKFVSYGCKDSGANYQSSQSFESAEFISAEFHVKACDLVSLADGLSCANQSAFPDECPNLFESEKGTAKKEMSTGKDASYGSDCINNNSTEVAEIFVPEDSVYGSESTVRDNTKVYGLESTERDNSKVEIKNEVSPDNKKASSGVSAEIFTKITEGECLENDGVNDHSSDVEKYVQEVGFGIPKRTEHSTQSTSESIDQDGVISLKRTKQDHTTYELASEVVPHIGKGSLHEGGNVFSHSENTFIQFYKEGNACNATKLPRMSCADEHQDDKGICQFSPEEKDCNGGQNCSATTVALKSPPIGCTTAKDDDENHQAFGSGSSFCGDEKTITDNSNCEVEKDASSRFYLEKLEDGEVSKTAIGKNSNNEVFCQQDFGDSKAGEEDISFDSNVGQPLPMEALSEPSNQELSSQTSGRESELFVGKNVESMAQSSKHDTIDRMEEKERSFEWSNSKSQVDTFEKFVGDGFDEEATPEVLDGNLFGICETSEVADKQTCMMAMDNAQDGIASQSTCIEPGNAVELFKSKEKSVLESDTSDFVDMHMDVHATGASEKVGKMDRNFKCKDTKNDSDKEFKKIAFSSHDVSSHGNYARNYQEVAEGQVMVRQGSVKDENLLNEIDGLTLNKISCENRSMVHSTEDDEAHCLRKLDEEMLTVAGSNKAPDFEVENPSEPAFEVVLISEDSGDLPEKVLITEQAATQVSEDHNGELADVSSHGNYARDHHEVAEEEVKVQQDSVQEETLLDEIDCLTPNKVSCENKSMTDFTNDGEAHCLDKLDDEILTIVESKKAADFEELNGITPLKSEAVVNCKTISAVCASPSHESEALELDLLFGEGEEFEFERPREQVDSLSEDSGDLQENVLIAEQAATQISDDHNGERTYASSHKDNANTRDHPEVAEEEVEMQQGSAKDETLLKEIDGLSKILCENRRMVHSTKGGEAHCLHKLDDEMLTFVESKKAPEFEVEKPSEPTFPVDLMREDSGDLPENALIAKQKATQISEDHNGEHTCASNNGEHTYASNHKNNARDSQKVAQKEVEVQQCLAKNETLLNEIDGLNKISCENRSMVHSTEGGEAKCLHKLDDEMLTIVESKKAPDFKVEKPREPAFQVDLIREDSGDLPENVLITEQASTQVSEEEVKVQQGSVKEETSLNEIYCLTPNKVSCENKNMTDSTDVGEANCSDKLDDEILTIVESRKAADFEELNGITPLKSEAVVNCKTISAACASPSHVSEASELHLYFGEREVEVGKPSEQTLKFDMISEDAGELPEKAIIIEQSATQFSKDQNDKCKHHMHEELPKNVIITEHAAIQASEGHNCEYVHQMSEKLLKNETIIESSATRVAEDQHDECEIQMAEVAKLKNTYLAISDEADFEPAEESKMPDNVRTKVVCDVQGSIVHESQENECFKAEAKAFTATAVEKVSKCEPSNLKQDDISNPIVENVEEAMEVIENVPETGPTTLDESLVFSTLPGEDFTAGDGQSCQSKLQAPEKASSCPRKEEEFKLNVENSKMKSNITGLIRETPQKVDSYLMKENPLSIKREQIGNVTAPNTLLKRLALKDLRNN